MADVKKSIPLLSKTTRIVFSKETKVKVGLEAIKGFEMINEIANEYVAHPTQVGMWKKQFLENMLDVF